VSGSTGIDLLLTGKQAPFHRAESTCTNLNENVCGADHRVRLLTELNDPGRGYYGNFHTISDISD
jgi:hypothetical protein